MIFSCFAHEARKFHGVGLLHLESHGISMKNFTFFPWNSKGCKTGSAVLQDSPILECGTELH